MIKPLKNAYVVTTIEMSDRLAVLC